MTGLSGAVGVRYGDLDHTEHSGNVESLGARHDTHNHAQCVWFAAAGLAAAAAASVPLLATCAVLAGATFDAAASFVAAAAIGAVVLGGGVLGLRHANQLTRDPAVNSLHFVTPVLVLVWLVLAGIDIARVDLFCMGSAAVISGGLLICNPRPDSRRGWVMFLWAAAGAALAAGNAAAWAGAAATVAVVATTAVWVWRRCWRRVSVPDPAAAAAAALTATVAAVVLLFRAL